MGTVLAKVVVVGSLNLDYIASVEHLPVAGQTIAATHLIRRFGGKGANQAIAAARQNAGVSMVGCVGDDDDGKSYLERLKAESINVAAVFRTKKALTGTALIAVDKAAENLIIVAAGANSYVTPAALAARQASISNAGVMLLQFEIPLPSVLWAIKFANRASVPVVLNPSPLQRGFPWGACKIQTLIVNEGEAQQIFDLDLKNSDTSRIAWSKKLTKFKIDEVLITRGARSTICFFGQGRHEVPTLRVAPIDTVGAGDAFAGAFTARRAEGLDLVSAIRLANCAGALTTLKPGAQEATPTRAATDRVARSLR